MTGIKIPYREIFQEITLDDDKIAGVVVRNEIACGDGCATLETAIANPLDSPRLDKFLEGGKILVIVNDTDRPTPTAKILDVLVPYLENADCRFIVATGSHRAPTPIEMTWIFGSHLEKFRDSIFIHDSKDSANMVYLGTTPRGTKFKINKLAIECDKYLVIGSVEPHYFAGYTGGRKAFLPGISAYETIEKNHEFTNDPRARIVNLDDNPVHLDMLDAISFIKKPIFSIQAVVDSDHRVIGAFAGDFQKSFDACVEIAKRAFCVPIKEKAEIVVAVVKRPMDISLYQSHKALEHCKLALKENGIIILVSACRDGIGPDNFYKLMASAPTIEEVLATIKNGYKLGYHIAGKMLELESWAQIWIVTDLTEEIIDNAHMRKFESVQKALDTAFAEKDRSAKALFIMDGTVTVPLVNG